MPSERVVLNLRRDAGAMSFDLFETHVATYHRCTSAKVIKIHKQYSYEYLVALQVLVPTGYE